ncbi:MAG: hypothetical protein MI723_00815, partial [Caulobacterales bacterium]|nr:hypothetical protein [Caulobacterales bacterium]
AARRLPRNVLKATFTGDQIVKSMRMLAAIAVAISLAAGASAADLAVEVTGQNGSPVDGAVVTFHPDDMSLAAEAAPGALVIAQRELQFRPFVSVAPVGSQVTFTNEDDVLHHVFSFSAAKRFDLRLFGRGEPRVVDFDRAGTVAVGCNIHDNMIAYLRIVETPFADRTSDEGAVLLADAPAGAGTVRVWHPDLRAKDNQIAQEIVVAPEGGQVALAVTLRPGRAPRARY